MVVSCRHLQYLVCVIKSCCFYIKNNNLFCSPFFRRHNIALFFLSKRRNNVHFLFLVFRLLFCWSAVIRRQFFRRHWSYILRNVITVSLCVTHLIHTKSCSILRTHSFAHPLAKRLCVFWFLSKFTIDWTVHLSLVLNSFFQCHKSVSFLFV